MAFAVPRIPTMTYSSGAKRAGHSRPDLWLGRATMMGGQAWRTAFTRGSRQRREILPKTLVRRADDIICGRDHNRRVATLAMTRFTRTTWRQRRDDSSKDFDTLSAAGNNSSVRPLVGRDHNVGVRQRWQDLRVDKGARFSKDFDTLSAQGITRRTAFGRTGPQCGFRRDP